MKLSIIIPVYNSGEYLTDTLNSVLNQTFKDFEIVIIDDGSTDNSYAICSEFALKYDNIVLYRQENRGVSVARNKGIELSRGEYIGFVDSDDIVEPKMYEFLINAAIKENADIVQCEHDRLDSISGVEEFTYKQISTREFVKTQFTLKGDRCTNYLMLTTKIFKRELFDGILFPEGRVYEDHALMSKIVSGALKVLVSDAPVYHYIKRENSIITGLSPKKDRDLSLALIDNIEFFKSYDNELYLLSLKTLKGFLCNRAYVYYTKSKKEEYLYYFSLILKYRPDFLKVADKYDKIYLSVFGIPFLRNIIVKNDFEPIQKLLEKAGR